MQKNIGTRDRIFRLIIAVLLLLYAYFRESPIALVLSLFVFYESATSWCIYYQLIGKNSCPIENNRKKSNDDTP